MCMNPLCRGIFSSVQPYVFRICICVCLCAYNYGICMHKILFVISFFCICIRMAGINCTILLFVYTYYISYGMPHFMFQLISADFSCNSVRSARSQSSREERLPMPQPQMSFCAVLPGSRFLRHREIAHSLTKS